MARAPSDFQEGVLAAAKWLRERAHPEEEFKIDMMLSAVVRPEHDEGTEARTVRQIVTFLKERQIGGRNRNETADQAIRRVAYAIQSGDWKSR